MGRKEKNMGNFFSKIIIIIIIQIKSTQKTQSEQACVYVCVVKLSGAFSYIFSVYFGADLSLFHFHCHPNCKVSTEL